MLVQPSLGRIERHFVSREDRGETLVRGNEIEERQFPNSTPFESSTVAYGITKSSSAGKRSSSLAGPSLPELIFCTFPFGPAAQEHADGPCFIVSVGFISERPEFPIDICFDLFAAAASRLASQEGLATAFAGALQKSLRPCGLAVAVRQDRLQPGSAKAVGRTAVVTIRFLGDFKWSSQHRLEFLRLIKRSEGPA